MKMAPTFRTAAEYLTKITYLFDFEIKILSYDLHLSSYLDKSPVLITYENPYHIINYILLRYKRC